MMEALTTALTSGLGDVADGMLKAIGSVVPVALPVMGGVAVVTIGMRIFRRVGKQKKGGCEENLQPLFVRRFYEKKNYFFVVVSFLL